MTTTALASLRVSLVDDDPDRVRIISRAIREVAPETSVCPIDNGATALADLEGESQPPDLILLDIDMAAMNGFDILSRLKSDVRLKRIPVAMLTSVELPNHLAQAYERGAAGHISDPSHLLDLRAVLGNTQLYWSAMRRTTGGTVPV